MEGRGLHFQKQAPHPQVLGGGGGHAHLSEKRCAASPVSGWAGGRGAPAQGGRGDRESGHRPQVRVPASSPPSSLPPLSPSSSPAPPLPLPARSFSGPGLTVPSALCLGSAGQSPGLGLSARPAPGWPCLPPLQGLAGHMWTFLCEAQLEPAPPDQDKPVITTPSRAGSSGLAGIWADTGPRGRSAQRRQQA